jgi:hypothetical protein
VSYDALLIHTVEVRRRGVQQDRFGQPIEPRSDRFADVIYRGRLSNGSGGERFTDRSRDVVVHTHKLYLEQGAELFEADRVTVRHGSTGQVLVTNADVTDVIIAEDAFGPHHIEAKLTAIRGGDAED